MRAARVRLWVRWSWRDLRARWPLVGAIALIIALGTGTYAGLASTAQWRRESNDASFSRLRMHDLRVALAPGAVVKQGALAATVRSIAARDDVTGVEERFVAPVQVDASTKGRTVLVPGEVLGVDVRDGPLRVDRVESTDGRDLRASDDGRDVVVLEQQFASNHGLPASGSIRSSGGTVLHYVGVGTSPQHFVVTGRGGLLFSEGGFAEVFAPLATAQRLGGVTRQVNEVVLTVRRPGDVAVVERQLRAALARRFPETGTTFTRRADEPAYRMLYEDIENDQQFWNIIAFLVLLGATFAAFNLTTRMVEAQRREIGVGMALGVRPRVLARRPLLVGAQIAALGVVLGVVVGLLLDVWLKDVFRTVLPLPVWRTPFQLAVFGRAAVLGFVLPLGATAIPVWRAVRVQPVDAIRTGHLVARGGRLTALVSRLPLPGRTYHQMPVRNLLRTPRRTLLTAVAIGAAITTLVAIIGMVDSFVFTLDRGEKEYLRSAADRLSVEFEQFSPVAAPHVQRVLHDPAVTGASARLRLVGTARPAARGKDDVDLVLDLLDFADAMWQPTLHGGDVAAVRAGGIVLSEKAARDLGVVAGDTITLRHPRRVGVSYQYVISRIRVAALHPGPLRAMAYLDSSQASLFNMAGIVNVVDARPAAGVSDDTVRRALFSLPGVASVASVRATTQEFQDLLDRYFGVLRVAEFIVLLLAMLIAFNSATIGVEERRREHATMLAFGLRPRTILGLNSFETMVSGGAGAVLGIVAGYVVVRWMMQVQLDDTMPELGVRPYVSIATILTALAFGVVAVGVAPLFTARRIRRMDIPATLRVVE